MPTKKKISRKASSEKKRRQNRRRTIGVGRVLLSIAIILAVASTVFLLVLRKGIS